MPATIYTKCFKDILHSFVKNTSREYGKSGSVFLISIALIVIILTVYQQLTGQ